MIQLATSDEPPAARNGVVRPVSGMTRVTPPITTNTWRATTNDRPTPSRRPKSSWPVKPMRNPRDTNSRYRARIANSPIRPSSSPRLAMM